MPPPPRRSISRKSSSSSGKLSAPLRSPLAGSKTKRTARRRRRISSACSGWSAHARSTAELKLANRWRFYHRDRRDPGREESIGEALFRTLHSPSAEAIRHEELARFEAAFEELDERGQQIITLVHLDGLSHREVAERLGIDEHYSRTVLARAMARLARLAGSD